MKTCISILIVILGALCALMPAQALPGASVFRRPVVEALEKIGLQASRESSDAAAKLVVKKAAEKVGRELPELAELVAKYGDDLGIVLRNSTRAELFVRLGDDAARAFIRNGPSAEAALSRVPAPDMARLLSHVSRGDARRLDVLTQRGQITSTDIAEWCKVIKEKGSGVISVAIAHPGKTLAALLAGGYLVANPGFAGFLCDVWQWVLAHPVASVCLLLVLGVVYVWFVNLLAKSPIIFISWLGKKLGAAACSKLCGGQRRSKNGPDAGNS